ncbi:MAG: helix-turn-helix transcriptional regulator, partial [Sciscionella sp.]
HPMTVVTLPSGLEVMLKDSRVGAWYGSVCDGCPFFPCHDALMALRPTRVKRKAEPTVTIVKPYGIVWKAGEWHLVAAPIDEPPTRYRLNLVDHLALTDLRFSYPNGTFHLQAWWTAEIEAYGKGDTRVVLHAQPHARDELLRLTLKSNSEVELIPLVTSYGGDVLIEEPVELRDAVMTHLRQALDAYETAAKIHLETVAAGFRNDDSRLRSTRGRALTE